MVVLGVVEVLTEASVTVIVILGTFDVEVTNPT